MYFFISDCHFRTATEDNRRISMLLEFFGTIKQRAHGLFVLGDLFEFGFEYRRVIPKSLFRVLSGLSDLVRAQVPVYYLKGNHDLWLGDFLTELGISVLESPVIRRLDGKQVFMSHGDEADTSFGQRLSQKIFKSRFNIFCFSLLHPDLGIKLAESLARLNRKRSVQREKVLEEYAQTKIDHGHELVVLGHIHNPVLKRLGSGHYLNTGDWIVNFSYGVLEQGVPRIERFTPHLC